MFHNDLCLVQALPSMMMIGITKQHSRLYHFLHFGSSPKFFDVNDASMKKNLWYVHLRHLSNKFLQEIASSDSNVVNDHREPCDCYHYAKKIRDLYLHFLILLQQSCLR